MRPFHSGVRTLAGLALVAVAVLTLPAAAQARPGHNGGHGNSGAAKMCQKHGWVRLAPSEDPTTAFTSQGRCVRYAAHGGTLVPVVASITVSFQPTGDPAYCSVVGTFTGFAPGSDPTVSYSSMEGGQVFAWPGAAQTVQMDSFGDAVATFASYVQSANSSYGSAYVQLSADGATSPWTEVAC